MQPEVVTSAAEEVRSYLEARLEISVGGLPDSEGWQIRGPRLCWFDDVAVGLVMLERNGQPVSLFVLPESDAESPLPVEHRGESETIAGTGRAGVVPETRAEDSIGPEAGGLEPDRHSERPIHKKAQ